MGAFESGTSFLAGVLAKVPEGLRAQVKEIFEKPEAKDAVTVIGDGVLARSDYSKQMDAIKLKETELNEKYDTLTDWYEKNKEALTAYPALKAKADAADKGDHPPKDPPKDPPVDPRKVVEEVIDERGRDFVGLLAFTQTLSGKHAAMFGEPLDVMDLIANPKLGKPVAGQPGRTFSLQDAYTEKYGEKVAAKAKDADDKRINDEVEKRLKDERSRNPGALPFPLRSEASVLDVLAIKDGSAAHTLDSAVAEFERLQQTRG